MGKHRKLVFYKRCSRYYLPSAGARVTGELIDAEGKSSNLLTRKDNPLSFQTALYVQGLEHKDKRGYACARGQISRGKTVEGSCVVRGGFPGLQE